MTRISKSPNKHQNAKSTGRLKSSPEARKLIDAALRESKKYDKRKRPRSSMHIAARLLRLPNHGQLAKMKKGLIKDTPAMKAAINRAERRAQRAYYNIAADQIVTCADVIPLAKEIESLAYELARMVSL